MDDVNELKIAEYFVLLKVFVQAHQNLTKSELNYIKKIIKAAKEIKKIKKTASIFYIETVCIDYQ